MDKAGIVNTYLIEIFKNHKLIKIFQKETLKLQEPTWPKRSHEQDEKTK